MQLAVYRTAGSSHLQLYITDCNIQHPYSAMQYNTHNKTHTVFATVSMLPLWYVTHIKKQIQNIGKNLLFTQKKDALGFSISSTIIQYHFYILSAPLVLLI